MNFLRWCLLFFVLLGAFPVVSEEASGAVSQKTILFEGQGLEDFLLENIQQETRYRDQEVPDTCYRQVPYTENVCRPVTNYRQECHVIPGHQDCRTVYEQACRTVTRHRRECQTHREPPVCRDVTRYREQCRVEGGGQRCRDVPGGSRCRTLPNGQRHCEDLPSRRVCEPTEGRRVCQQVPYTARDCDPGRERQVCRDVPYQDRECEQRPRQECRWIPDDRVCQSVPYTETVCGPQTMYRQEAYACTRTIQVPYLITLKTHQASIHVEFTSYLAPETKVELGVSLTEQGELVLKQLNSSDVLVFVQREIQSQDAGEIHSLTASYKLILATREHLAQAFQGGVRDFKLGKTSMEFSIGAGLEVDRFILDLKISKGDELIFEKNSLRMNELTFAHHETATSVAIDLERLGAPRLGGLFSKKYKIQMKLRLNYEDLGTLLSGSTEGITLMFEQEVKIQDL